MSEVNKELISEEAKLAQSAGYDRRLALKKMGRFAFYTAPAMIAMLSVDKSFAGDGKDDHRPRPSGCGDSGKCDGGKDD